MHFRVNEKKTYIASKLSGGFGGQQRYGIQLHFKSFPLGLFPAFFVLNLTNKDTGELRVPIHIPAKN